MSLLFRFKLYIRTQQFEEKCLYGSMLICGFAIWKFSLKSVKIMQSINLNTVYDILEKSNLIFEMKLI